MLDLGLFYIYKLIKKKAGFIKCWLINAIRGYWTFFICDHLFGSRDVIADLKSFCHDAAHNSTHPECALHVQFAQRRFELVDGN